MTLILICIFCFKLWKKYGTLSVFLRVLPANTRHSPNVISMLAHRLRRWPNMGITLRECLVFAGLSISSSPLVCLNEVNSNCFQLNPTRRGFTRWPAWEEHGKRIAETRVRHGSVWQQSAVWGFVRKIGLYRLGELRRSRWTVYSIPLL